MRREPKGAGTRAAIYVRISADPSGQRAGVRRQEKECTELAAQLGWDVVRTYEDNDVSASRGTHRPSYEALLGDVQAGTIDAVIAWHPDRLHRHLGELEHFIDVLQAANADVQTVEGGAYELNTPAGRMAARVVGTVARYEVEQKGMRQRAANRQAVEAGKSLKGRDRLFGYTHSTYPEIIESESAVISDLAARVLKGESLRSLAAGLNASGVRTTRGNLFSAARIRELLTNPRLAGLAPYEGELHEGAWVGILTAETHKQLVTMLTASERLTSGGSTARKALLPGFVYCGSCGERMYSATSSKNKTYSCKKLNKVTGSNCGSMNIRREPVDAAVRKRVLLLLSHQEEGVTPSAALADAVERISVLESRLAKLDEDFYVLGDMDDDTHRRLRRRLLDRLEAANREASEATFGAALAGLPRDAPTLALAWDEGSLDFRRSIIDACIERVVISKPSKAGSVGVDPADRVEIVTRARFYGEGGIAPKQTPA
jgi:site-specific DNA recombinase